VLVFVIRKENTLPHRFPLALALRPDPFVLRRPRLFSGRLEGRPLGTALRGCGVIPFAIVFSFAPLTMQAVAEETPALAVLHVATSGDYQPFSFHDVQGALVGFDVDVARRLAVDLGRGVEFVPFRWPELEGLLGAPAAARTVDIAMSGVTIRQDRAVHGVFTRPYAVTGAVAVIRRSDRKRFRRVADLDRASVRVAVNSGGHLEQVARQHFTRAQIITVADNRTLPDVLARGGADAVLSEEIEARTWPADRVAVLGPFTRDRKAYLVPRDAADLAQQVNDWLAAREADGWLNEARRRWLGERTLWTAQHATIEALVAAMELRLQLMPLVAAVKRREGLPIEDPAQEARVIEHVRAAATAARLNADDVAALFRVQMEAARSVEHRASEATVPANVTLADLRPAVAAASDQVIAELARCRAWRSDPRFGAQLDHAVRQGLDAQGLSPQLLDRWIEALHRIALPVNPSHPDRLTWERKLDPHGGTQRIEHLRTGAAVGREQRCKRSKVSGIGRPLHREVPRTPGPTSILPIVPYELVKKSPGRLALGAG
jgi:cyclohexadienyl dehydratase